MVGSPVLVHPHAFLSEGRQLAPLHSITSSARASYRPQFRQCSPCPFVISRAGASDLRVTRAHRPFVSEPARLGDVVAVEYLPREVYPAPSSPKFVRPSGGGITYERQQPIQNVLAEPANVYGK